LLRASPIKIVGSCRDLAGQERQIVSGEFFSIKNEASPGNKSPKCEITPVQRIFAICCTPDGEKSDAHKSHSDFIAAGERHYRRFRQSAWWFLHSMRPKESTLAGSVHPRRLVIKANRAALDFISARCDGLD
jgi:hypothetical protein